MPRIVLIALFLLVVGGIATLIKWEYKRFQRRQPARSKAFRRHLEEQRAEEPGRAYRAPPARVKRAFEESEHR